MQGTLRHARRRRSMFVASLSIALAGSVAVAVPGGAQDGAGTPETGGSISLAVGSDSSSWLPGEGDFGPEQQTMALTFYDGMTAVGSDGVSRPYLAQEVTPNDDFTEWTVKLRPGVTFHDGTPLTAAKVKEVFDNHYLKPGSNTADGLAGTSVEVVDDMTVRYLLPKPNSAFTEALAFHCCGGYLFSPDAAAAAGEEAGLKPAGTGAFRIVENTPGQSLVVERNPDYWQEGLPYLDRIEFQVIADDQTKLASFQQGALDGFITTNAEVIRQALDLQSAGKATVYAPDTNNGSTVLFNTAKAPLDDVRIRRALTHALDQEALIDVRSAAGIATVKDQLFGESSPWHSAEVGAAYASYDPAKAMALVEEYKNDPARSDGKAVGDPVSVTYTCPRDPAQTDLNQAIVELWQAVGVDASWPTTDPNNFIFDVLGPLEGDHPYDGQFETACWAFGEMLYDPANWLDAWFGQPRDEKIVNVTDFADPDFASALAELQAEGDPAARKAIMDRIGTILNEQATNAWVGSLPSAIVVRPELRNLDGWVLPDGTPGAGAAYGITYLSQAWLDQ